MSHLAPRPPQHPAHRRIPSNSQTQAPDKRIEIVGKLENCIGEVLEALKAYKSPQQQSAHQNANQMFQQRVMASQGRMGGMSDQDWLGTMMQCLNESMRTQQSSFVRNTTLDVALKVFATEIFETLGLAYFREPFDKLSFPSAHHQLPKGPVNLSRPSVAASPQYQLHGMPTVRHALPLPQQNRPMKRTHPTEHPNAPTPKRSYTSEALRQAAGPMGPPQAVSRALGHSTATRQRLCVDFWDVQEEREVRKRQAILGYGGKWYVFQCHQHPEAIFFKTAEGARHHMVTHHALSNQRVDFLDIVQELGVEVMNCDVARAEKNNVEAVNLWNQIGANAAVQHSIVKRPTAAVVAPPATQPNPPVPAQPRQPAQSLASKSSDSAPVPPAHPEPLSVISLSDDETSEEGFDDEAIGAIKQEIVEKKLQSFDMNLEKDVSTTEARDLTPSEPGKSAEQMVDRTEDCQAKLDTTINAQDKPLAHEKAGSCESPEKEGSESIIEEERAQTATIAETADCTPDLTPDSPESSELSEPPSLEELECFEPLPLGPGDSKVINEELEEGEIDESCIQVAPYSPSVASAAITTSEAQKLKKRRRISAAGSAQSPPKMRRKKLPVTPQSSRSRSKERKSFSSPQEVGPSAHDQFKTKACKKCSERFYFRAQLATHMKSEHPEVVILE
ncbi:hypothetical protein NLG97_g2132 [Lecanicillium saksenae]|uniref:Uncharacterized protein n=1 Tax=Lecanicillium saksenae TaxID=468837 RepID=A0ACC1R537_9HYPO|nr:hypothetical protein NLG97_g2132 [Lecanicillium saksenae]